MVDDSAKLKAWMDRHQIEHICVISPHLDDAAYSLAACLTRADLPARKVFTVFTSAGSMTNQEFARATGFANAEEEHACRRREDERAMARLKVPFKHCGIESGRFDEVAAQSAAAQVLADMVGVRFVALLPLGAGAVLDPVRRFARRMMRKPSGAPCHGEHLWVRDQMRTWLGSTDVPMGYYAEIPYQWANGPRALLRRARALSGHETEVFRIIPDSDAKLAIAKEYESQTEFILGTRPSYQRRVVSIAERVFLPS